MACNKLCGAHTAPLLNPLHGVQALPPSESASPAASTASSSKTASKKAGGKGAKKQPKQPRQLTVAERQGLAEAHIRVRARAQEWGAMVLHFATHYATLSSTLLDGWQLLDWLEVRRGPWHRGAHAALPLTDHCLWRVWCAGVVVSPVGACCTAQLRGHVRHLSAWEGTSLQRGAMCRVAHTCRLYVCRRFLFMG
jgi:hypothetical protein